jgi:transglutaminase-like putative cysteine protease
MATSLSLLSVFSSLGWLVPVMGAIILVAGVCALVRASPLPSALEPVAAATAVLLWATVLYAHSTAHYGVIPGRAAFRELGGVARNGFDEIHRLPTPAPAHHGLVMLTMIGVAAIALVVDLLTVTLRRAALAGLPLLALFTVGAATGHHGVGLVAFIAAGVGYLWLLYADNRDKVARWGAAVGTGSRARPASAWSTDAATAPPPASLGRQVGAVALTLGVVVPFFIPGLHTGINQKASGAGGAGSGGGSVQTFDPIVRVGANLRNTASSPVMTYRTTASLPGYLRLTSLDQFDGNNFTERQLTAPADATVSENLPIEAPQGQVVTTAVTMSTGAEYRWLPIPVTALGVSVGSDWRYDPGTATIFSATTNTTALTYTVRSVPERPSSAQLRSAPRAGAALAPDLSVPDSLPKSVGELADRVTRKSTSRFDKAVDIQNFLTSPRFSYDTSVPANTSSHALADFLLQSRSGFCQQFATSMAVMARLEGIPARVAVGFTRGKQQGDSWLVTTHDAHAWPELWFEGYGWLAFEPTPRGDGQAVAPAYSIASSHHGHDHAKGDQGPKSTSSPRSKPTGPALPDQGSNGSAGSVGRHPRSATATVELALVWLLVLAFALGVLVPATVRVIRRQRRLRRLDDPAHAAADAWAEVRDSVIDLGLPWDDARSPRQIATTLLAALDATPKTSEALLRLAKAEEVSRYAATPAALSDARRDVTMVRAAAAATRTRAQQVRAWVLPRSTLQTGRQRLAVVLAALPAVFESLHHRALRVTGRGGRARTT